MVRDITLGQFMPGRSMIHRLDARSKILLLIAYIAFIFVARNYMALLLITLSSMLVVLLTKVKFTLYLKSMKVILFVVILTGLLNIFYGTGNVLWEWWVIKITDTGLHNAIFVTIRIATLVLISSVLTFTTSPSDLTDALEKLMKPLAFFHVKVHEIAMMMTIALRFLPILTQETNKIMMAQMARGADFETGGIIRRAKAMVPILVPLFVSAFRRANDLAMAMEARCYHGGSGRTRMKPLKYRRADWIALSGAALYLAAVFII